MIQEREAIETIPAMVWSAWPDGHADFFNRRWQEYTGLSLEQSLGWDWGATVHPEDAEQYFAKWHECIAAGQPIEEEVRFRRAADGEYRWFLDSGVPLRDDQGNVLKWYGVVTDIDDLKRAEAVRRGRETNSRDGGEGQLARPDPRGPVPARGRASARSARIGLAGGRQPPAAWRGTEPAEGIHRRHRRRGHRHRKPVPAERRRIGPSK